MSAHGRHRAARPDRTSATERIDTTSGMALIILALLGLAGPAWALGDHAADLLSGSAERHVPVSAPDTAEPTP
ncbi:hypothetical protein RKE29_08375 [Streptomyces sp. B1866]|uniref:hypothetical protein n=1 Tax=Streptomyces sp. B1866 TaxID=3075431 RepID=UPI00289289C4|nr:hypothetical protein [Streptomyces sp. B1866]MDT3396655.1 hypothetical protein [Streptomyces sp. B1866]